MSNRYDGRHVGGRVCLVSDSARRGVIESEVPKSGYWVVRFADKSRNVRVADLKLLPSDAASFEPSEAPLSCEERRREERASAVLSSGLSVAASTKECAECRITLKQARWGPCLARE